MVRKIATFLLIASFVFTNSTYSQSTPSVSDSVSAASQGLNPVADEAKVDSGRINSISGLTPYDISIPEEFGSIEEVYQGAKDAPLVVHIQNVHANYKAQVNIKNILNHLTEKYGFSLIQTEGAVSKLDPTVLKFSFVPEANLKVVDYMMREGRITGADAFAVETAMPIDMYGLEDDRYYLENLRLFKAVFSHRQEIDQFLINVDRLINSVGRSLFPQDLMEMTRKTKTFSENKIDLIDYLLFLSKTAEAHQLKALTNLEELATYPNLVRLVRLYFLEQELNQNELKKESESLKAVFGQKAPEAEETKQILSHLETPEKGMKPREYFSKLTDLTERAEVSTLGYPQIRKFAEYLIFQDEINREGLFSEMKTYEAYLEQELFKNPEEQALLALIQYDNLLQQYFRLGMSRETLALYLKNQDKIKPSWISAHFEELARTHQINFPVMPDLAKLDSYMGEVERYYQLVLERDPIFSEKIFSQLKTSNQQKTIVLTGGFHKDGLVQSYKKENISYVIVSPKVDVKEGNENYLKVMLDEDAVVGSVFAGTFALEVVNLMSQATWSYAEKWILATRAALTLAAARLASAQMTNEAFLEAMNGYLGTYEKKFDSRTITTRVTFANLSETFATVTMKIKIFVSATEFQEFELVAEVNVKNGNFTVRPVASKPLTRPAAIIPQQPVAVRPIGGMLEVAQRFKAPRNLSPQTRAEARRSSLPVGVVVPDTGLSLEDVNALWRLETPEQVSELRRELETNPEASLTDLVVKIVARSNRETAMITEEAIRRTVQNPVRAQRLMLIETVKQTTPHILAVPLEKDASLEIKNARIQSALRTLQLNAAAVVVVYGENVKSSFGHLFKDENIRMRVTLKDVDDDQMAIEAIRKDLSASFSRYYDKARRPGGFTGTNLKMNGHIRVLNPGGRFGRQLSVGLGERSRYGNFLELQSVLDEVGSKDPSLRTAVANV